MSAFEAMVDAGGRRCMLVADGATGLRAVIAIDSMALGPAAGGIRTLRYAHEKDAIADAMRLAAAMTLKCAIAGLDAGGGKIVVLDGAEMNRPAAFRQLGAFIEDFHGLYHAAGDLGTTRNDLHAAASATRYVNADTADLAEAAARGVLRCMQACAEVRGLDGVSGLRVAVQGCGAMGAGVARTLAEAGARVTIADIDRFRTETLAREIDAEIAEPQSVLAADVDIVAPCASGGVVNRETVGALKAWAICGAANNQIGDTRVEEMLVEREVLYVPDFLASSGAVIRGVARSAVESDKLIDSLRGKAVAVLSLARETRSSSVQVAIQRARDRLDEARPWRAPI